VSEAKEGSARAPLPPPSPPPPEVMRAAWRDMPWRTRLILVLQRRWPRVTRLPLVRRWFAGAGVRLITEVALAKRRRREGALPDSERSPEDPFGARGDRLIGCIILVVGVMVILGRHMGRLLLSLAAFVLLVPFLLWPPWWPLIRSIFDVVRRDEELRQRWEDEAARRDLESDRDPEP
jgi:hypothetical protein